MREDAARPGRIRQWGKLRSVKRPACSKRQTGACRRCGLAVRQPSRRHEEPVGATDALRPTGGGRGAEGAPSQVSSGRSGQPQPPDQCPTCGAINSDAPDWCPAGEGPTSTPLQQHFPRGQPFGRTRATGITHPGFYGRKPWKKPNSATIITVPKPAKEGLRHPFPKLPPKCSEKFTPNPPHSRPGYLRQSPKVRTRLTCRRSSAFLRALRVS